MASPLIGSLRRAFPQAYIAWLADPSVRELLQDHPDLDEVILWPKGQWRHLAASRRFLRLAGQIRRFRSQLRQKRFDTVMDVQGLLRSRLLSWMTGAENRIGFDSGEPGKWFMTRILSKGPSSEVMGSEYLFLLNTLGIPPVVDRPGIVLSARNRESAAQKLKEAGILPPYVVLCPFTTRPQKHWTDTNWARLTQLLWKECQMPMVLLGGPGDDTHSRRLQSLTPSPLFSLTGKTSLGESAAIVRDAAMVIGVDTGLTHLGTVFLRPTVALFGATCPYLTTVNPLTRIVYHRLTCSPCKRKPTCHGRYDCMKSITVEAVYAAARDLLKQTTLTYANSSY